jgi:hypothetical protein
MILLRIYLTGVIAGVLYPIADQLMNKYSKIYREAGNSDFMTAYTIKLYRDGPIHYKLFSALLPLVNFVFVFSLGGIIWLFLSTADYRLKKKFIRWLAGNSMKHFRFNFWLVIHIFPKYKKYYYSCLEERQANFFLSLSNAIIAAMLEFTKQEKEKEDKTESHE